MKKITSIISIGLSEKITIIVFLLIFTTSYAQVSNFKEIKIIEPVCIYKIDPKLYNGDNFSTLRKKINLSNTPCSVFNVTYIDFTPEAQTAFQHAVDIWSHIIESPVQITIIARFQKLGETTLGSASPASFNTISGNPNIDSNTWYPAALYEKLLGQDRSEFEQSADINTQFNSDFDFYFGTDGNPPSNKFDFVSIVLHELGHGLGFVGFGQVDGNNGSIRSNNRASIYDHFIENGNEVSILNFTDPSTELKTQFTSNNLFCNSPLAISQNSGILPKIYAPSEFDGGSSYSHWDENIFLAGDINSLMTPQIARGEANHTPGDITLGFFKDMGWSICSTLSIDEVNSASTITTWPNPFSDQITLSFSNLNSTKLNVKLIDIKGSVIFSKQLNYDGSNSITLNNIGNLQSGIYIISISDSTSNLRFTEKIIKY